MTINYADVASRSTVYDGITLAGIMESAEGLESRFAYLEGNRQAALMEAIRIAVANVFRKEVRPSLVEQMRRNVYPSIFGLVEEAMKSGNAGLDAYFEMIAKYTMSGEKRQVNEEGIPVDETPVECYTRSIYEVVEGLDSYHAGVGSQVMQKNPLIDVFALVFRLGYEAGRQDGMTA